MKVIFHRQFYEVYACDPAAAKGRMETIVKVLEREFKFTEPEPAQEKDLQRVHGRQHIESIKKDPRVFQIGSLAAGGSLLAGELAVQGQPAFGLIRPPGHHAGPHSCWGFCYFNNVAISIKRLLADGMITTALILDFDLHYGDGTAHVFAGSNDVHYVHPDGTNREAYLRNLHQSLQTEKDWDMLAVSAGFDRHEEDWGGMLASEDYFSIGQWIKEFSLVHCRGRRFGVLEGGYNHAVLGRNVSKFLQGFRD